MLLPDSIVLTDHYGLIYLATHRESGKQYVGQTVHGATERWREHINNARSPDRRGVSYVDRAIHAHGADAFIVETIDWAATKAELDHKERFWIAFLDTRAPEGYNLKEGGANGRLHPESIAKMAASKRGSKLSPDHPFCQKGRIPHNKGIPMSEEHRQTQRKIALARYASGWIAPMKGRENPSRRPVVCVETGERFDGVSIAGHIMAQRHGSQRNPRNAGTGIARSLKHPQLCAYGYHWVYADNVAKEITN